MSLLGPISECGMENERQGEETNADREHSTGEHLEKRGVSTW